jgi:hypothetical protein
VYGHHLANQLCLMKYLHSSFSCMIYLVINSIDLRFSYYGSFWNGNVNWKKMQLFFQNDVLYGKSVISSLSEKAHVTIFTRLKVYHL